VKQPAEPGRKIYPPRCAECGGKGRIAVNRLANCTPNNSRTHPVSLHRLFQAGSTSCCLTLIPDVSVTPCLSLHTVKPGKLDGIKISLSK